MGLLSRAAKLALSDIRGAARELPAEWAMAERSVPVWAVPDGWGADVARTIAKKLGGYDVVDDGGKAFLVNRMLMGRAPGAELSDPSLLWPLLGSGAGGAGIYGGLQFMGRKK